MKITTRQEAIRNGQRRYYTGKPCKYGHVAERYTVMGNCCECAKATVAADRDRARKAIAGE